MFHFEIEGPSIAVLGANGCIGARLIETMHLGKWARPRPVVRRPSALFGASRFGIAGAVAEVHDCAALERAFQNCDAVVSAIAGDPALIVNSVVPVYRAAEAMGVRRLVYLSSASVHGQSPSPGTDEASRLSSRQSIAYNNAKVEAERRLCKLRRSGSVEIVILRPGIVYGPRSRWTGSFASDVLAGTAYLIDGGKGICNGIYVDNLVHAVRLAIATKMADGNAYLLGETETLSWADLCQPVLSALGYTVADIVVSGSAVPRSSWRRDLMRSGLLRKALRGLPQPVKAALASGWTAFQVAQNHTQDIRLAAVTREMALLQQCHVRLPWTKAKRELGYSPVVSFEEASRRSVEWLKFAGYPVIEGLA